jgi:hypothetical protein
MDMPFYNISDYLYDLLGLRFQVRDFEDKGLLPYYLTELYEIRQLEFEESIFVLFRPLEQGNAQPAILQKHAEKIYEKTGRRAVYVSSVMDAYSRSRLTDYRVPFIIPGNQMYLPDLGIDFREYFKTEKKSADKFNPSTQVVILRAILKRDYAEKSVTELAPLTGYARMTMTRAYEEMSIKGLGEVMDAGKEKLFHYSYQGRELWDKALPFLKTPVKSRQWMIGNCHQTDLHVSGLSALSFYTNLADDKYPTFAVTSVELRDLKQRHKCKEIPFPEPGAFQVEFWKYEPLILMEDRIVDRLSLYLSLIKDETDDRTLMALNDLLDGVKW